MKKMFVFLVILTSGVIFVGCDNNLNRSSQTNIQFISPTPPSTNSAKSQQQNTNQVTSNQGKQTMTKTLKDFIPIKGNQVMLHTNKGDITIKLFRKQAPLTTTNFLHLVQDKFYDGIVFHRVIADFMAQAGDPLTKDETQKARWGTGGPGYTIMDEFDPELKHNKAGIVSMANINQPNTGGSQFFITFGATPWLDGKHAVFGEVIEGMDVVNKLQVGDKINSADIVVE